MKRYFITGTDTDCGKTYASCQLAQFLTQLNYRIELLKPVASGCYLKNGVLVSEDAVQLKAWSKQTLEAINPWRFEAPISPHLAAKSAGIQLRASEIVDYCLNPSLMNNDYVLIEGAGGLLVPLNEEESWVEVLTLIRSPVILVVGIRLGCINHARLTAAVLRQNGIACAGWIANLIDPEVLEGEAVIETLVKQLAVPHLATIPYNGQLIDVNLSML